MKKILIAIVALSICLVSASAQVLADQRVQNTLWTGFGLPPGDPDDNNRDGFRWPGFIDTVQARIDVGKFTMDGMLNWWAGPSWPKIDGDDYFAIANSDKQQFLFLNENRSMESYYLNFIWRPFEGFEAGMGTELNWSVGPAPYTDGWAWEPLAHVEQGDLARAGELTVNGNNKVVGYMHYANNYAKKALAARYKYKDIFQAGIAIPSWWDDPDSQTKFTLNIAAEVHPIPMLTVAAAYENLIHKGGNFYTGLTLDINKNLIIDAWFGFDGIALKSGDTRKMWGTGAAIFIKLGKLPLWVRPEAGFTKYVDSDYTNAFYTAARVNWDISDTMHLGTFTSFAWGAENKVLNLDTGFTWNIRPDFTFDINKNHSLTATFEFESNTLPNSGTENKFLFGVFWKYKRPFSSK